MDDSLFYWSSSEITINRLYAWYKLFKDGDNGQEHKQKFKLAVRAARYF
jgi:hypothetical protein